jgi:hypothetical protein
MTWRVRMLATLLAVSTALPARAQTDSARARDSLSSGATFRGTELRRLPIDDPRQAFTLLPGVVLRSGEIGIATAPSLSIRGGIAGQTSVYVDGAPVRFQTLGTTALGLAPNGISEAWITTGVAPASVADAAGGVIAYTTPSGGDRLVGQARWDSDEPFGSGVTVGYNRIEGSLGGPLPVAPGLTFFVAATLQGQRSSYRGLEAANQPTYLAHGPDTVVTMTDPSGNVSTVTVPQLVQWSGECAAGENYGFECQGLRRPMDWSTARRAQAKLLYNYGTGSSVSLTALASDLQQRFFPGQAALDPALSSGSRTASHLAVLNWHHPLGVVRRGAVALDVNLSLSGDRQVTGPLTTDVETTTRDPLLGIAFETLHFTGVDGFPLPVTDGLVRTIRTQSGLPTPYWNRTDLLNWQPYRLNPFGMTTGWPTSGLSAQLTFINERRLQGRWALDWTPGAPGAHQVTLGVDAERTDLSLYASNLIREIFLQAFRAQPTRLGVFAGDRLAWQHAVLDVGLRYDRFTPGGAFPKTPGRIATHPSWSPNAPTSDAAYDSSVARVFDRTRSQGALSPRVRLGYDLTPTTAVRLAYGQWVEPPPYAVFFSGANSDLGFTTPSDLFGRDVDFATPSLVEVGVRQDVGSGARLDVAAYSKDLPDYAFLFRPFPDPADPTGTDSLSVPALTKRDFGNARGVDVKLEWHVADWATTSVAYSLLRSHRDGAASDVTHQAVAAVVSLRAPFLGALGRDLSVDALFRTTSGLPYSRLPNIGAGEVVPFSTNLLTGGSERLPWTKRIDLRVTKAVQAGGRDWTLYLDVRNLLNFRNTVALFAETGDVVNPVHRGHQIDEEYVRLWDEAGLAGALDADGQSVHLDACGTWGTPVNCVGLTRVERRFGDGDGLYTRAEQDRALNTFYDAFFGSWRFYGSGRTLRMGMELVF